MRRLTCWGGHRAESRQLGPLVTEGATAISETAPLRAALWPVPQHKSCKVPGVRDRGRIPTAYLAGVCPASSLPWTALVAQIQLHPLPRPTLALRSSQSLCGSHLRYLDKWSLTSHSRKKPKGCTGHRPFSQWHGGRWAPAQPGLWVKVGQMMTRRQTCAQKTSRKLGRWPSWAFQGQPGPQLLAQPDTRSQSLSGERTVTEPKKGRIPAPLGPACLGGI